MLISVNINKSDKVS